MVVFLLGAVIAPIPCAAKLIPRRDPHDGALDATLIVIMKPQSADTFVVEETFLGSAALGDSLWLPGFQLVVEDTSQFIAGRERSEPIQSNTRILVFLKPSKNAYQTWEVAGLGNCYFWSHDPHQLAPLREMARRALDLRASWNAAHDLTDERQRVEALWPYLWNYNGACQKKTLSALKAAGPAAGDFIAAKLLDLDTNQQEVLLWDAAAYRSQVLHAGIVKLLQSRIAAWGELLARRGGFATYDQVDPPRMRYFPRRPQDAGADEADDLYGVLYNGFVALAGFRDRADLRFIRESATWALKYRFKQVDDAVLGAFQDMPDKENLPIIKAIWEEYSQRPFAGNELHPFDLMKALDAHRYMETIPLMALFVNVGFGQDIARRFLVQMTGVDFAGDTKAWTEWYEAHR